MIITVFDRVENVVGKEENAGYQHFLLFPHFKKTSFPDASKGVIVWEWVKNIVGKKEKRLVTSIFSELFPKLFF